MGAPAPPLNGGCSTFSIVGGHAFVTQEGKRETSSSIKIKWDTHIGRRGQISLPPPQMLLGLANDEADGITLPQRLPGVDEVNGVK